MLFFFQAEDGIRDGRVTGVQTCALPIYRLRTDWDHRLWYIFRILTDTRSEATAKKHYLHVTDTRIGRSEERRVGKECSFVGSSYASHIYVIGRADACLLQSCVAVLAFTK